MILLMKKTKRDPKEILFIEEADPTQERWYGRKVTVDEAKEISHIEDVRFLESFDGVFDMMMTREDVKSLYFDCYRHQQEDLPDYNAVKAKEYAALYPGHPIRNLFPYVAQMRMQKDADEVVQLKTAIEITDNALQYVMKHLEPGMAEYQAQADFEYQIMYQGADGTSFPTIAGSGANGTMLHYETNRDICEDGTLLLMDLGAKYQGYCADITRTYPVNGHFTQQQRAVYEVVLEANRTIAKTARPGMTLRELNDVCKKVLAEGCIRLGLIENEEEIGFWKFVQYKFAAQWQAVKAYANKKDVQILGDIPIYVSADSVDAWVGGKLFELDAEGRFARVAGCPPDYFSADGQLWGNPLYNWTYHKQTGYAWWVQRVRHALGIYDLLRIDHFRGFDTYWAIPADSATAKTGKWENGPGMELFEALEAALGKLPIIAEDLGELFPSVRKLLADSTFPGMKVLQFAFSGGDNEYLPHNHVKNSVVYPGTHDNTTITAWWESAATPKEKATAAAYLHLTGAHPTAKEVAAVKTAAARTALLRAALGSVADRAIIPMYDWLGLGEEAHLNTPGKLGGNWAWRAAAGFESKTLAKTIADECSVYCRV